MVIFEFLDLRRDGNSHEEIRLQISDVSTHLGNAALKALHGFLVGAEAWQVEIGDVLEVVGRNLLVVVYKVHCNAEQRVAICSASVQRELGH